MNIVNSTIASTKGTALDISGSTVFATASNINIDWDDFIHAGDNGIVIKNAATGTAIPHRKNPLRIWHLVI